MEICAARRKVYPTPRRVPPARRSIFVQEVPIFVRFCAAWHHIGLTPLANMAVDALPGTTPGLLTLAKPTLPVAIGDTTVEISPLEGRPAMSPLIPYLACHLWKADHTGHHWRYRSGHVTFGNPTFAVIFDTTPQMSYFRKVTGVITFGKATRHVIFESTPFMSRLIQHFFGRLCER